MYVPSFRSNIDGMTRPGLDRQYHLDHVPRMRGDQIPVDFVPEQRVDMLIADRFIGAMKNGVAQAAHAWHQLDVKEAAQTEDWLTLTLRVGMKRVGLGVVPTNSS